MKSVIVRHLQNAARKMITRHRPIVVAVAGSTGKTFARQAIALALGVRFRVRSASPEGGSRLAVACAILGIHGPVRTVWEWWKAYCQIRDSRTMPEALVLEYDAETPGDLAEACRVAEPHVAVLTAISPERAEHYLNFAALAEEMAMLGDRVAERGLVVMNADDPTINLLRHRFAAKTVRYGMTSPEVFATDVRIETRFDEHYDPGEVFVTTRATVVTDSGRDELVLRDVVGDAPVLACLAALAAAEHYGIPVRKAVKALNDGFQPIAGRFRPLPGIKGALILDDTCDASPASVVRSLEMLKLFSPVRKTKRRIVVLGQMDGLGEQPERDYRNVGRSIAHVADLFIAVGGGVREIAEAAREFGMREEQVISVHDAAAAGRYLDRHITRGDIVLVNGARHARMERAVKDIMAEPLRADEVLCR